MKYIIWEFDKKTKVPKELDSGAIEEWLPFEMVLDRFKNLVNCNPDNNYAIRIER